jgi:RND family efflux transporter MFP subunit
VERAGQQLERTKRLRTRGLVPVTAQEEAEEAHEAAVIRRSRLEEQLVKARTELRNARVASPVVGIVTERLVNPSESVRRGQRLLTIARIEEVLVAARLAEEHLEAVHLQQDASVSFGAYFDDVLRGQVSLVNPVIDSDDRTFEVLVRVPNAQLRLKPGLSAFVRLERHHRSVLAVPSISLVNPTGPGESTVFVVESGRARYRRIRVGAMAEGLTQVIDGLEEGEQVVTVGQLDLNDGDPVNVGGALARGREAARGHLAADETEPGAAPSK